MLAESKPIGEVDVRDSEPFRKLGPNVVLCECQNARTQNSFVVLDINERECVS